MCSADTTTITNGILPVPQSASLIRQIQQYSNSIQTAAKRRPTNSSDSENDDKTANGPHPRYLRHFYLSRFVSSSIFTILLIFLCITHASGLKSIPGCIGINDVNELTLQTTIPDYPLRCLCNVKSESLVTISCFHASTLDHLTKAIELVAKANATVDEVIQVFKSEFFERIFLFSEKNGTKIWFKSYESLNIPRTGRYFQITLNHANFTEFSLSKNVFNRSGVSLRKLLIESSAEKTTLQIEDGAFNGVEVSLQELSLNDCNIEKFPTPIGTLKNLKSLSLAKNRLVKLDKISMQNLKKLEKLDLEANFISTLEVGLFDELSETLEILSFGEHNFINEKFFNEIQKLRYLKTLDLSKADGITSIPNRAFKNLNKLDILILTGCSLDSIQKNTFEGLTNLKHLDVRVNLINTIECDSFLHTPNIKRLSIAGNFLNKTENCTWNGLEKIEDLDLGWNEFETVENSFGNIGSTLKTLDFRHNKKLTTIDRNAFFHLKSLQSLNLSDTQISKIHLDTFATLEVLKALDLSRTELDFIEPHSFHVQKDTLETLSISHTKLRRISAEVFKELEQLKYLDLSGNKWICDIEIKPGTVACRPKVSALIVIANFDKKLEKSTITVIDAIKAKYKTAAREGKEFILEKANDTICDRPYAHRSEIVTSLDSNNLFEYDVKLDTTITTPKPMQTSERSTTEEATTTFNLLPKASLIGDENATNNKGHEQTKTRSPPEFDINSNRLGEKPKSNHFLATAITLAALTIISIAIIVAIVLYMKKKRQLAVNLVMEMKTSFKTETTRPSRR